MPRREKIALALLFLIATILLAAVNWDLYKNAWQAPLGPALALPSQTAQPLTPAAALTQAAGPTFAQMTRTAYIEKPALCGGPQTMSLLAIGSDTRAQGYLYGLADVIRYVRIDFVAPRVSVLEFPRDLWVEIPEIADHYGISHGKLNQAYLYGNPGMGYYKGEGKGPGLLARTLDLNFGARPDHYIAANMHTFVDLVNVIGGIDITLPYSVDGRKADQDGRADLYFAPGPHHLNGEQALMLGRIRQFGTFARADQQNRVLCALREKLFTPSVVPKLPEIINTFYGAVQTDLSPLQISQLACLVPQLKSTDITFTTFPRALLTEDRTYDVGVNKDVYIFRADFESLRLLVQAFDIGAWPDSNPPPPSIETPSPRGEGSSKCP